MTSEDPDRADTRTLILRLWRDSDTADAPWRCSVEDPLSRHRRGFSTLADLVPFLQLFTASREQRQAPAPSAAGRGLPETRDTLAEDGGDDAT